MMRHKVDEFVKNYHTCQRGNLVRHTLFRTLTPFSIPERPWTDISVNFVTGLPWSNVFHIVCVVVYWLMKMRNLITCCSIIYVIKFTKHFNWQVFKLLGLAGTVIWDRGPQFLGNYWGTYVNGYRQNDDSQRHTTSWLKDTLSRSI